MQAVHFLSPVPLELELLLTIDFLLRALHEEIEDLLAFLCRRHRRKSEPDQAAKTIPSGRRMDTLRAMRRVAGDLRAMSRK